MIIPTLRLAKLCFLVSGAICLLGCQIDRTPADAALPIAAEESSIPLDLVGKRNEGNHQYMASMGYTSMLEIKADGTFEKVQTDGPIGGERIDTFRGSCRRLKDGTIEFHLTSKHSTTTALQAQGKEGTTTQYDMAFWCRCAVDSAGFLVIDHYHTKQTNEENSFVKNDSGLEWKTCYPAQK